MLIDRWKTCLRRVWIPFVFAAQVLVSVHECSDAQEPPFTVPDGFVVQRVAHDALAHDCFCMTLDNEGRPVISGPGYLRTLVDRDQDGIYDTAVDWTKEIQQGAQGLWVEGQSLYWVSDGGLWRSQDTDGDLIANTRPERVLELPTGGEHDAHAIRRGPDGSWYLIAGNFAANIGRLANDATAPVTRARAGTLWRISPDFAKRSVWAHGMRNCYDFDFLPDGQLVTYDSDDEREATLPWYRPTRVMVLGPGSDAGWCGAAWKDDDYRVTMPQVIARLGRGSPTGVLVYEHHAFPEKYRDAVFALDWTFGRVIAIYPSGNVDPSQRIPDKIPSEIFMEPSGTAGFAPTAACIAPDGSLMICVGGRGTMGAIYRVMYTPASNSDDVAAMEPHTSSFANAVETKLLTPENAAVLDSILNAPAPWTAWSSSKWRAQLTPAAKSKLLDIVAGRLPVEGPAEHAKKRVLRAAQLLTRIGERVPADVILRGANSTEPACRAAAWWIAGRQAFLPADEIKLQRSMPFPKVVDSSQGTRWETHLGSDHARLCLEAVGLKRWSMANTDGIAVDDTPAGNALRRTWLWALNRTNQVPNKKSLRNTLDSQIAKLLFGPARSGADKTILDTLSQRLSGDHENLSARDQLEVLTVMQGALGDRRGIFPLQTDAPADVSDGYRALFTSQIGESARNNWARWALYFASNAEKKGLVFVHAEATRTMAMMESSDQQCMTYLLNQIKPDSHPTSDIHMLCCLAQSTAPRTQQATTKIASSLADMVRKVTARGLYTDNQWPIRLNQLVSWLLRKDNALGEAFVQLPIPCCNEDLALINALPPKIQDAAKEKMRNHLRAAPAEDWSIPILKYATLGNVDDALRDALHEASSLESLRSICVELLSKSPREEEYDLFITAIEDSDRSLWPDAWRGLAALDGREPGREFPALAKLVSASLNSSAPLSRSTLLARTRTIASRAQKPSPPSSESWTDWNTYFRENLDEQQLLQLVPPSTSVDIPAIVRSLESMTGDPKRGLLVYQAKCGLCHGGQSALGPSLVGVAKRFAREDLARAIFEPSRDIPDRYRAVRVLTVDDEVLTGMVIYNAADGVTLQVADGSILRINQDQIQEKAYSTESLMPSGLLEGKSPLDIADLFAYLGTQ